MNDKRSRSSISLFKKNSNGIRLVVISYGAEEPEGKKKHEDKSGWKGCVPQSRQTTRIPPAF